MRAKNHITSFTRGEGIPAPVAYSTLGNLHGLASMLPQFFEQLAGGLADSLGHVDVYDSKGNPADRVADAAGHLRERGHVMSKWAHIGPWVRRTSWERGTRKTGGLAVLDTDAANCSPYLKGSSDKTAVSTAMTWTDGIELSGAMKGELGEVSLSSRTGLSNEATNSVTFADRKGRLCGRFGPLSSPGALVARK